VAGGSVVLSPRVRSTDCKDLPPFLPQGGSEVTALAFSLPLLRTSYQHSFTVSFSVLFCFHSLLRLRGVSYSWVAPILPLNLPPLYGKNAGRPPKAMSVFPIFFPPLGSARAPQQYPSMSSVLCLFILGQVCGNFLSSIFFLLGPPSPVSPPWRKFYLLNDLSLPRTAAPIFFSSVRFLKKKKEWALRMTKPLGTIHRKRLDYPSMTAMSPGSPFSHRAVIFMKTATSRPPVLSSPLLPQRSRHSFVDNVL